MPPVIAPDEVVTDGPYVEAVIGGRFPYGDLQVRGRVVAWTDRFGSDWVLVIDRRPFIPVGRLGPRQFLIAADDVVCKHLVVIGLDDVCTACKRRLDVEQHHPDCGNRQRCASGHMHNTDTDAIECDSRSEVSV